MRPRLHLLTAAAALTLTAALLAALAAGPGGAQTPTRFFFLACDLTRGCWVGR
jgi:hypothetical protein